jgi:YbbR domain-containing protein
MRLFAKNLRTFLLALALGVSVWVSAVSAADPDEEHTYPRPIPLEVFGQDPSLVLTSAIPTTVDVTLRAPHSVWNVLTAKEDSIRATLDLSGLSTGKHVRPVQLTVSERPYQIILTNPSSVSVDLEAISSQTFPLVLSLSGQPAAGYQSGDATMEPTEVAISGPESIVRRAARARVLITLDGVRESIDTSLPIEVVDSENQPLQGLTINPESVHVSIPISLLGGFRDVAVKVIVQGQQAAGYRIENISYFPPVVTIFADDPELVNALAGVVQTLPLDLQDRREDISARLSLDIPDAISVVGTNTIQVNVNISPIQTSLTLPNLPIDVIGLSEGLSAQPFPQAVDVIISGPVPVLDALTAEDITVYVDATGLKVGAYQLEPKVEALVEDISIKSILPGTVEVVVTIPVTPSPTPFPP